MRSPLGNVIAGGQFTLAAGVAANCIARWNGTTWSPLGSGMSGGGNPPLVTDLTTLPNGELIAGGRFVAAGGVSANNIARWDGASWHPLGSGLSDYPNAIAALPNGDVVAGGLGYASSGGSYCSVRRWNGTSWSTLGSALFLPSSVGFGVAWISDFRAFANGDLVVAGEFTMAGSVIVNRIARWNGTTWSPLGSGLNGFVHCLTTLPNGDLVAGGEFTTAGGVSANRIARWDGTTWSTFGAGINGTSVFALTTLPNGDLVAAGGSAVVAGLSISQIVRWDGVAWSTLGTGIVPLGASALAVLADGDLMAGGSFTVVQGGPSPYLAQLTTTCPASASPAGSGCSGAGGAPLLEATTLPWIGATCRTRCSGLPSSALVASVTGLNPSSLALASLAPQALPGCTLHATPDAVVIGAAANGAFDFAFAVPRSVALVGLSMFHQTVVQELGPQQQLLAMTAANALRLTVGAF